MYNPYELALIGLLAIAAFFKAGITQTRAKENHKYWLTMGALCVIVLLMIGPHNF